ncbi:hypothetical protein V1477_021129 [Vespula maculifrons]|uniref:Uncharacterized protein n=1 Tax=Vespula maculifrons TaxID=7453 RepID=A0ABD2AH81_VESMC
MLITYYAIFVIATRKRQKSIVCLFSTTFFVDVWQMRLKTATARRLNALKSSDFDVLQRDVAIKAEQEEGKTFMLDDEVWKE